MPLNLVSLLTFPPPSQKNSEHEAVKPAGRMTGVHGWAVSEGLELPRPSPMEVHTPTTAVSSAMGMIPTDLSSK
jgi:hypothetical protein